MRENLLEATEPQIVGVYAIAASQDPPPADALVERARAGDLTAYDELYRRHVGRVYGLCLRMTARPDRAEELTQQTFVRAWERLSSFRGDSPFAAWLGRVAVNVVLGERRSRGRRETHERSAGELVDFDHPAQPLHAGAGLDLDQAIGRLPERARAVFVLHDVEGYRHEEIGRLLDIAVGTSKTQLHRARKLLREALR